ncbi:MAG: hypothetical protein KJZ54_03325 [Phycisphaerales bacterium]|nr:hypothetical protein [Phycisphaerales bacterium]
MAKKRKVRRKRVMRKAVRRARRSASRGSGALASMSTAAIAAELARRQNEAPALRNREAELMAELDDVRAQLAGLDVSPARGRRRAGGRPGRKPGRRAAAATGRKRPQNDANLETYLARVLKGKTMGVTEVANAVKRAGYKTTSPNFRTIVNQTLIKSEKIKKLARGKYTTA